MSAHRVDSLGPSVPAGVPGLLGRLWFNDCNSNRRHVPGKPGAPPYDAGMDLAGTSFIYVCLKSVYIHTNITLFTKN